MRTMRLLTPYARGRQMPMGSALGVFKRRNKPLPDFFDFGEPISHEAAEELRSVQKDFEVIDEDMWK